jgi:hypothetical protein
VIFETKALPQPCDLTKTFPKPIPSPQIYKIGSSSLEIQVGPWIETSILSSSQCIVSYLSSVFTVPAAAVAITAND